MDDSGKGMTSDAIAAAGWIYENKSAYNIRVANFRCTRASIGPFYNDPPRHGGREALVRRCRRRGALRATTAARTGLAERVRYAPGNDPFVITVGALDIGGTERIGDDSKAPWSAYGRTYDGFWKPEICAAGRYMVGPVPLGSTLAALKADKLVGGGYIELSGTSFATRCRLGRRGSAPRPVSPALTPDQVKATLMARARAVPKAAPGSCGVGQVNAAKRRHPAEERGQPEPGAEPVRGRRGRRARPSTRSAGRTSPGASVSWDSVSWDSVSWSDVSWGLGLLERRLLTDVSRADVSCRTCPGRTRPRQATCSTSTATS